MGLSPRGAYPYRRQGPQRGVCEYLCVPMYASGRESERESGREAVEWSGEVVNMREVILLSGPPGGGKSTVAQQLAASRSLSVYDRDDPKWSGERAYIAALRAIGRDPGARAVVIRSAAASRTRRSVASMVGATAIYLVVCDPAEAQRRVIARGRGDMRETLAGIKSWFNDFDRLDGVPDWSGKVDGNLGTGRTSREW